MRLRIGILLLLTLTPSLARADVCSVLAFVQALADAADALNATKQLVLEAARPAIERRNNPLLPLGARRELDDKGRARWTLDLIPPPQDPFRVE